MQQDPLLEQLDWFFTSVNWTTQYPNTMVHPMSKPISDHIPCKIMIGTSIPKSTVFRFENFWPAHLGFLETVQANWSSPGQPSGNSASTLAQKFKALRHSLKHWSRKLSNLTALIENCNKVIFYLDSFEECRSLVLMEWNLRKIIRVKLLQLLRYKNIYWRKRHTVNRIRLGDECTKYFHAMATLTYRRNSISQLRDDSGFFVSDHESKAALLWTSFKNRMGVSSSPKMHFYLPNLVQAHHDLSALVQPFFN